MLTYPLNSLALSFPSLFFIHPILCNHPVQGPLGRAENSNFHYYFDHFPCLLGNFSYAIISFHQRLQELYR